MARRYVIRQDAAPVAPISGIDYRTALNEEQYAAVSSEPGPALVIAGAGSGKTRTLTYRVAWLLDHGTDPWNILLLTFTNKAAREMTERVRSLIPLDLSRLWSGTFHSIANRILRQHAEYLGYTPAFTIMDSDDRKSMIKAWSNPSNWMRNPPASPSRKFFHPCSVWQTTREPISGKRRKTPIPTFPTTWTPSWRCMTNT